MCDKLVSKVDSMISEPQYDTVKQNLEKNILKMFIKDTRN